MKEGNFTKRGMITLIDPREEFFINFKKFKNIDLLEQNQIFIDSVISSLNEK